MRRTFVRAGAVLAFALLAGCASLGRDAAFQATLPQQVPHTAPAIAVIGDLQMTPALVRRMRGREYNLDAQLRLIDDLKARIDELDALVIVGDLVFTAGSGRAWRHFDELVAPFAAKMPVLPAIGNHDYHCVFVQVCFQSVIPARFLARFPWFEPGVPYDVPYGDLVLVFLDSETEIEAQAAWLRERMADYAERYRAALVFFHRPPFSNSIDRGAHGDPDVERFVVPVLESAGLPSVVMNGHVHGYEHLLKDGIHYFTTAGGGGPRGPLGADRPGDVYQGPDCETNDDGSVIRPFNYLLISPGEDALTIDVRGFCRADPEVRVLESTEVAY